MAAHGVGNIIHISEELAYATLLGGMPCEAVEAVLKGEVAADFFVRMAFKHQVPEQSWRYVGLLERPRKCGGAALYPENPGDWLVDLARAAVRVQGWAGHIEDPQ